MIDNRDWRNVNWLWGKFLELICIDTQDDIIPTIQPKSFKPAYLPHIALFGKISHHRSRRVWICTNPPFILMPLSMFLTCG